MSFHVSSKTPTHRYFLESEGPPDRAHDFLGPENKTCRLGSGTPVLKGTGFGERGYWDPDQ